MEIFHDRTNYNAWINTRIHPPQYNLDYDDSKTKLEMNLYRVADNRKNEISIFFLGGNIRARFIIESFFPLELYKI